ncbi:Bacterial extracellular solute-binding protein [Rubrobacter radiotolerans]|uniref:Bacterial extracellular solute-binding protein n=2 Tax=Rubrobacter radiotolerans TaxID=42256 RepID=A0A023X4Y5_RUBRA|nr:Bacterial extracellular solute-binding protein [Rubrobacter radiotolerans]SMC06167.1 multiple sugar transport system substrate-binding protein [Rubrobacter radiotolerans DSM 5868]
MRSRGMSRRDFLRLGGAVGVSLLGACGCAGADGQEEGAEAGSVEWTTWGNPGEVERFTQFTEKFNRENEGITVRFTPIPNVDEYDPRLFTEFLGGTGPDVFYTSDTNIGTWVEREIVSDLTDRLTGPESLSPPEEVPDRLWGGSRTPDGTYYGAPVDCNPYVFWYNKGVLREAGVDVEPAEMYERDEWNWDTFTEILDRVRGIGKTGFVQGAPGPETFSWAVTNGGSIMDGERFVLHEDERSVEAHRFMVENLRNRNMVYAASLPGNQGPEALFLSNQVAFVTAGRWFLPVFSSAEGLEFDIVPWPTNTGRREPASVPSAYIVMSREAADPDAAFRFLTSFISREGQIFRLQGGGNAVPSLEGADEVVLEGGQPGNARYFLEAREIGFAYPATLSSVPGLNTTMVDLLEPVFVTGGDVEEALAIMGNEVNLRIQQQLQA